MKIPLSVAECPNCCGVLWLEIEETEMDGTPTEFGIQVSCYDERCTGIADQYPYVYWLPITVKVYEWAKDHARIAPDRSGDVVATEEYDRRRLMEWEQWAKAG